MTDIATLPLTFKPDGNGGLVFGLMTGPDSMACYFTAHNSDTVWHRALASLMVERFNAPVAPATANAPALDILRRLVEWNATEDTFYDRDVTALGRIINEAELIVAAPVAPVRYPDAADLQGALQWLLDDMHDAGETHRGGEGPETIYDSVENACRALVNAGGEVSWYDGDERIPVVDGDENADVYGCASDAQEAMTLARTKFVDKVACVKRYGPIKLRSGAVLAEAFVALTEANAARGPAAG